MLPARKAMHKGPMRNRGTHMWKSPFSSSKPQSPGSLQLSLAPSLNQRNKLLGSKIKTHRSPPSATAFSFVVSVTYSQVWPKNNTQKITETNNS